MYNRPGHTALVLLQPAGHVCSSDSTASDLSEDSCSVSVSAASDLTPATGTSGAAPAELSAACKTAESKHLSEALLWFYN